MIRTCEICNFTTKYKNVFDNHNKSARHIQRENTIDGAISTPEALTIEPRELFDYTTNNLCCLTCKKIYTTRSGLWKHKKTCKPPADETKNTEITTEMFQKLLDSNIQLHNDIKELKESHENQIKTLLSTLQKIQQI
jgi:hypothetical protein